MEISMKYYFGMWSLPKLGEFDECFLNIDCMRKQLRLNLDNTYTFLISGVAI